MNNKKEMEELQKENDELRNKVQELEERLKKYTNGENHKRYYEKNKDKIKEQGSNYLKKLKEENPEKLKEYRRNYYLKKKQLKEQDNNI
jgi:predicted MPP superfamily phosphohydrolase